MKRADHHCSTPRHERRSKHASIADDELRVAGRQCESRPSRFVLVSGRGTAFTTSGFARMIEGAAREGLGLELSAHRHMPRHTCGYALTNRGHDTRPIQRWRGYRSIARAAVDTAWTPNRFNDFRRD